VRIAQKGHEFLVFPIFRCPSTMKALKALRQVPSSFFFVSSSLSERAKKEGERKKRGSFDEKRESGFSLVHQSPFLSSFSESTVRIPSKAFVLVFYSSWIFAQQLITFEKFFFILQYIANIVNLSFHCQVFVCFFLLLLCFFYD
jgi:hypothetical protein